MILKILFAVTITFVWRNFLDQKI